MKPENLEEEGRCPALAALVGEGWKLYGPASGFQIFRCPQPACKGHDRTVPVFWGICYSCIYSSDYSYEYHEKDGYLVKTWPPYRPQKGSMFEKAQRFAVAGTVDERGKWFSPGLPVTAFDFDQLLKLAVHEAKNRSAAWATEPSSVGVCQNSILVRTRRPPAKGGRVFLRWGAASSTAANSVLVASGHIENSGRGCAGWLCCGRGSAVPGGCECGGLDRRNRSGGVAAHRAFYAESGVGNE